MTNEEKIIIKKAVEIVYKYLPQDKKFCFPKLITLNVIGSRKGKVFNGFKGEFTQSKYTKRVKPTVSNVLKESINN